MPSKRTVYLALAMFLGMILGDIIYDALEISFLNSSIAASGGWYAALGGSVLALRPAVEIVFDLLGIAGGYFAGKAWWRIIYVEDRRKKKYKLEW